MTPQARTGRTWVPEEYLDDITPEGRPSPDAWLCRDKDGKICVAKAYDFDDEAKPIPLEEGQTFPFYWCDELGAVKVQFKDDGTYKVVSGEVDQKATHFWAVGDPESLEDSLADMAKTEAANLKETDSEYVLFDVQMATWSEKAVQYRLVIERGAARFVQVAGAN